MVTFCGGCTGALDDGEADLILVVVGRDFPFLKKGTFTSSVVDMVVNDKFNSTISVQTIHPVYIMQLLSNSHQISDYIFFALMYRMFFFSSFFSKRICLKLKYLSVPKAL